MCVCVFVDVCTRVCVWVWVCLYVRERERKCLLNCAMTTNTNPVRKVRLEPSEVGLKLER